MATIAKQNEPRVARAEACLAGDATPPLEDDLEYAARALALMPYVRYRLVSAPARARRAATDVALVRAKGKSAESHPIRGVAELRRYRRVPHVLNGGANGGGPRCVGYVRKEVSMPRSCARCGVKDARQAKFSGHERPVDVP